MEQPEVKFRGIEVFMDGRPYVVPSLSTRQFRDHYKELTEPVEGEGQALIEATYARYMPLIGMALRRNYPEVMDESLWDLLDLQTFKEAVAAIQNATGLRPVAAGE